MINEWISLRWERGTRYYEVHLQQDLFGEWVLTQVWGRRGTELGRMVHTPCASYQDGRERLTAVQARREQRGYKVSEGVRRLPSVRRPTETDPTPTMQTRAVR
jgi:predicted DNA-binding WGR domain protein